MENKPIITISGRNVPPAIEEKYDNWTEGAYIPLYMKLPGVRGIDSYKIIRKNFETPARLLIYHSDNLESRKKRAVSADGVAIVRDRQITFGRVENFFSNTYELMRTFKKDEISAKVNNDTIDWFNRWASRVYVPLLLEIPGVKACNFFGFVDFKDPRYENVRFVYSKMPHYVSVTYFKDTASAEEFNLSKQLAAYRHDMELEFSGNLKTVWNTEYQLFSSHRP
jgi:hypothetical protein